MAVGEGLAQKMIQLWHTPARSPDLNPVEQVWAHLRKKLKAMDLADAVAKKPVLGKTAYMMRIRSVRQIPGHGGQRRPRIAEAMPRGRPQAGRSN